jgi:hypothetical protein
MNPWIKTGPKKNKNFLIKKKEIMEAGVIVAIVLSSVAIALVLGFLWFYVTKKNGLKASDGATKYSMGYNQVPLGAQHSKAYATVGRYTTTDK